MFDCAVQCYPWDLLDEGIDAVLDRLQDEIGITGLTLVVACDQKEQFRPHQQVRPRVYSTSGGVFFQPDLERYHATRLKPPIWEQHRKLDALAKVSQSCGERQLDLRLSLSPFTSHRLVGKHHAVGCKNAFDGVSRNALCLSNPDVREYLCSLMRDLSVYDDVSAIIIDEVQWPAAIDVDLYWDSGHILDCDVISFMEICFCESCLRGSADAGVDGEAALRWVRNTIDRICREGGEEHPSMEEVAGGSTAIGRYMTWTTAVLTNLFRDLRAASSKVLILDFQDVACHLSELPGAYDLIDLADRVILDCDKLEQILAGLFDGDSPGSTLTPASLGDMELLWRVDDAAVLEAPELVRQVAWAAEAGARGLTVCHYGAVLENQFEWVHQALRNARRISST